ncbi:MAG TPA: hypothetical protein VGM32_09345, partial [Rhodopila sp.]
MKSAISNTAGTPALAPDIRNIGKRWSRWRPAEIVFWIAALGACMAPLNNYLLLNEMAILALFAVSLDLILGYTGIVSLGHAAFFGLGAYTAALLAKHFALDPLLGMVI